MSKGRKLKRLKVQNADTTKRRKRKAVCVFCDKHDTVKIKNSPNNSTTVWSKNNPESTGYSALLPSPSRLKRRTHTHVTAWQTDAERHNTFSAR